MPNKTKITMAGARAFAAADGREAVLWDSIALGLGLRARPNGRKTWIVHRRCNGSVVRRTLGALDALTVENARHAARALLDDAEGTRAPAAVPTVRTFAPIVHQFDFRTNIFTSSHSTGKSSGVASRWSVMT